MSVNVILFVIANCAVFAVTKPISVSFGTSGRSGPIEPAKPISSTANPLAPKHAAPVHEEVDDIPPPSYKPLTPHQYRTQILSQKPKPDLVLGTPVDIKYTPALTRQDLIRQKNNYAQQVGLGYRGPVEFEIQDYQVQEQEKQQKLSPAAHFVRQYQVQRNDDNLQTSASVSKQNVVPYQVVDNNQQPHNYYYNYNSNQQGSVPQIGVIYSSGIRYYIPQYFYQDVNSVH